MKESKFITIATTRENLRMIRRVCAETGEKQHELLLRLLSAEVNKSHDVRVRNGISWWIENTGMEHLCFGWRDEDFILQKIKYRGIECICLSVDFRGAPYFHVKFELKPMDMSGDIGGGAGMSYIISF